MTDENSLVFEDPVRNIKIEIYADTDGDVVISPPSGEGSCFFMRASDAASVGDWLRRTFAEQDWRTGVEPEYTSIPLDDRPWPSEHESDCPAFGLAGKGGGLFERGDCKCPMGNL